MSERNVELFRRIYELFNERDHAALRELFAPDAELHFLDWGPFPHDTFRGWDATLRYWEDIFATVDDFRFQPEEVVAEGDFVVATIHNTARERSSGLRLDMRFAVAAEIHDGMVVRFEVFRSREEALEAAGLSEQR